MSSTRISGFAKKEKLTLRYAAGINLLDGKMEVQQFDGKSQSEPICLLYSGDTLKYLNASKRITGTSFLYRIVNQSDSVITFSRDALLIRYFTSDTMQFSANGATVKRCHYSNNKLVRIEFNQFLIANDSFSKAQYVYLNDFSKAPSVSNSHYYFSRSSTKPEYISVYPFRDKWTFCLYVLQ